MIDFIGPVEQVQFARRGKWEEALVVDRSDGDPACTFLRWVSSGQGEFAAEFFGRCAGGAAFWGMRFAEAEMDRCVALAEILKCALRADRAMADCVERAGRMAGGALFAGEPDYLELGMLNAWQTFGPLSFWNKGSARGMSESFERCLPAEARFGHPTAAPIALEAAYAAPVPHWLGFPVSQRADDGERAWRMDLALVRAYIRALEERKEGAQS